MKVKCKRDNTTFNATPVFYPPTGRPCSEESSKKWGYKHPARYIDCPTCGRAYFQEEDGVWRADRDLVILEDE